MQRIRRRCRKVKLTEMPRRARVRTTVKKAQLDLARRRSRMEIKVGLGQEMGMGAGMISVALEVVLQTMAAMIRIAQEVVVRLQRTAAAAAAQEQVVEMGKQQLAMVMAPVAMLTLVLAKQQTVIRDQEVIRTQIAKDTAIASMMGEEEDPAVA